VKHQVTIPPFEIETGQEWGKAIHTLADLKKWANKPGESTAGMLASSVNITQDIEIPAHKHIHIPAKYAFISGGGMLEINGSFTQELKRCFVGFPPGYVYGDFKTAERHPEWWGDEPDAIQCAIDSGSNPWSANAHGPNAKASAGIIRLTARTYRTGTIDLRNRFSQLLGNGPFSTKLEVDIDNLKDDAFIHIGARETQAWGAYGTRIEGMNISFPRDHYGKHLDCVRAFGDIGESTRIHNVWMLNLSGNGFKCIDHNCLGLKISDSSMGTFLYPSTRGIDIRGGNQISLDNITINPKSYSWSSNANIGINLDCIGPVLLNQIHIEDCWRALNIDRTMGTPAGYKIQGLDSWFAAPHLTTPGAAIYLNPAQSNREVSVVLENIKRGTNGPWTLLQDDLFNTPDRQGNLLPHLVLAEPNVNVDPEPPAGHTGT
jgi:hypothetical protein